MKKLLLLSNLITAGLLVVLLLKGCSGSTLDEVSGKQSKNTVELSEEDIVLNYSGSTFKSLTIPQAAMLKANFMNNLQPVIQKTEYARQPTELIKYDLEDLKNFIWYVEYYAKATGKPIAKGDLGVNIHLGQYPQDLSGLNNKYLNELTEQERKDIIGKQTIFFVPTIKTASGRMEFNPKQNYLDIKAGKIKDFVSLKAHHGNEILGFKFVDYSYDSPVMDLGELSPPPPWGN